MHLLPRYNPSLLTSRVIIIVDFNFGSNWPSKLKQGRLAVVKNCLWRHIGAYQMRRFSGSCHSGVLHQEVGIRGNQVQFRVMIQAFKSVLVRLQLPPPPRHRHFRLSWNTSLSSPESHVSILAWLTRILINPLPPFTKSTTCGPSCCLQAAPWRQLFSITKSCESTEVRLSGISSDLHRTPERDFCEPLTIWLCIRMFPQT